ncbi:MAG: agmatinase [Kordiimonas sp.]
MRKIQDIDINLLQPTNSYEWSSGKQALYADTVHLIGFGFDGTACFRKGTRYGPDALRDVSGDIESYSPYLDKDLEDIAFVDLGNLDIGFVPGPEEAESEEGHRAIEAAWQKGSDDFLTTFGNAGLRQNKIRVLTLGGEHSISWAPIKAYLEEYPDLCLLHLDAHADLRDGYLGYHYSHASIIRRALDHFGPSHDLIQYGIRSGTADEYRWMKERGTLMNSRDTFLEKVKALPADRPIYLTFDLDYFDPSFFPGTGTPEPGGEDFHSFVSLSKILRQKNFVGCDVVELSPPIDASGNSNVFATKVVRELILCLASS